MKVLELFETPSIFNQDIGKSTDHPNVNHSSPVDPEVNYLDDLKFYIDNNNKIQMKLMVPAIDKHQQSGNIKDAYKFYLRPIEICAKVYCKKYGLEKYIGDIFSKNGIVDLAKAYAEQNDNIFNNRDGED